MPFRVQVHNNHILAKILTFMTTNYPRPKYPVLRSFGALGCCAFRAMRIIIFQLPGRYFGHLQGFTIRFEGIGAVTVIEDSLVCFKGSWHLGHFELV